MQPFPLLFYNLISIKRCRRIGHMGTSYTSFVNQVQVNNLHSFLPQLFKQYLLMYIQVWIFLLSHQSFICDFFHCLVALRRFAFASQQVFTIWAKLVNPIIETCCVESAIFTVHTVSRSISQFQNEIQLPLNLYLSRRPVNSCSLGMDVSCSSIILAQALSNSNLQQIDILSSSFSFFFFTHLICSS